MKGDPLRGVHAFYSASAREWWAPLRPDRQVSRRNALVGVLEKPSEFAGPRRPRVDGPGVPRGRRPRALGAVPAHDPHRAHPGPRAQEERRAGAARPTATRRSTRSRRSTPPKAPRGAETAVVGGRGGRRHRRAHGEGPADRHRHGVLARRRRHGALRREGPAPRLPEPDPDPALLPTRRAQRARRDAAGALGPRVRRGAAGNPTTFDYGRMRETWLIHLCTDWMGDEGVALEARLRVPQVQLRRRHAVAVGHGDGPLPGRGRAPGRRHRALRREPARGAHDAGPRHRPAAQPRARPGAPARGARAAPATCRRSSPPSARGTPASERPGRAGPLPVGRGAAHPARAARCSSSRSTGRRSATRSRTRSSPP